MGNRLKAIRKASLLIFIVMSVVACTNNYTFFQHPSTELAVGPTDDKVRVSLMLDRYPNAMHAFIYTAVANGYFREKGIELEIKQPGQPDEGISLVGLGVVDLTLASQPGVLFARANDIPVVSIAAIVRQPLNYLMIPKASPVQSPKNLVNRRIGYPGDGVSLAILKTMMRADDSDSDQVSLVNVKRDLVHSIAAHQVDAIVGGNINEDRILLANRMQPVRTIQPMLYGVPNYYEMVIVANERMVKSKPELLKSIWEILARAQQDVINDPEQAVANVMNKQSKSFTLSTDVEEESLTMLLSFLASEDKDFGIQSKSVWSKTNDWLDETGLMRKSIDSDDAFINIAK